MDPNLVPLAKKREFLDSLSEDKFRDEVIRPLFQRKGFKHGAELCGPAEAGKDCFFRCDAPFGTDHIAVVQTKIGNLNLSRSPSKNVEEAITQLRTAMNAKVNDLKTKQKRRPNFGFFCTSGQISEQAKAHIIDTVANANLRLMDVDDLVPELDDVLPELWQGINADKFPYLKALENRLLTESEFASLTSLIKASDYKSPVSDSGFVPLKLARTFLRPKKISGEVIQEPEFEETGIEELLRRREHRFLIVGEAGSGKSTLLKRIAEILCRDGLHGHDTYIPVLIKAIEIATNDATLAEQILSVTEHVTGSGAAAFGVEQMDHGKICLLVDAVDEIGAQSTLESFFAKLVEFDRTYPGGKVIVAARNYSYLAQAAGFARYVRFNVAPIGLKEAAKIIKNVGKVKLLQTEKSKEVMRQLESIHGFELNPLVVTVFAASSDSSRKDIPCNITELFAKFTELMLGRWDTQKGLSQQYEANLKSLLLQKVAYRMHQDKVVRLLSAEFRALIERELEELGAKEAKIDTLLDEILNRSGLLREVDGYTEFRHLLIQEFFAGKAISDESLIPKFSIDQWWRRALVFYFGSNPSNEAGLRSLCKSDETYTADELFNLGVALGLASQACYFVKVRPKAEIIHWSMRALASATASLLEADHDLRYPIHVFLYAYLAGRDAVGARCTSEIAKEHPSLPLDGGVASELEEFWLIVGLMEGGHLAEALQRIKRFKPSHALPLLSLDMGAFLIEKIRAGTKEQKKIAKEIGDYLRPAVVPLIGKYLKEFKSRLLEIQKGQLKELPPEPEQATLL